MTLPVDVEAADTPAGVSEQPEGDRARPGLFGAGEVLVVVGVRNPLEAKLCELAGVSALHVGGHAIGEFYHLMPDFGLIEVGELAEWVRRISDHVALPIFADGDQCGESLVNVRRSIRTLEAAGAAAISIEDSLNPKGVGLGTLGLSAMLRRIDVAVSSRRSSKTLIVARTDSAVFGAGPDYLSEFGCKAAAAGADLFFPVHIQRHVPPEKVAEVARAVGLPIMLSNATAVLSSSVAPSINLLSGGAERAMLQAAYRVFTHIAQTGEEPDLSGEPTGAIDTKALIDDIINRSEWLAVANQIERNGEKESTPSV